MLITLKKDFQKAIVDDNGAQLISYTLNDKEYLWQADQNYWKGYSPILFPVVGATLNDSLNIDGKDYNIPKHGIVRGKKFSIDFLSEDRISLVYVYNEESLKQYPYKFKLYVEHMLIDNGVKTSYKIKNLEDKPIHFCIGGHPSFNCPLNKCEKFEDYSLVFSETENIPAYYTEQGYYLDYSYKMNLLENTNTIPLKYSDFDNDAYILCDLKSNYVDLINTDNKKGIHFIFDDFPCLVIWTPTKKQAPFICIEPWHGLPAVKGESGKIEDKPYCIKLDKHSEKQLSYSFSIIQ